MVKRNILLNPGPATTTDSVKLAQVVPDICPRESEFGNVLEFICTELTKLAANEEGFTTVLFGGSGTSAVESILSSVVQDDYVVIINNGAYGKRMKEIAEIYGIHFLEYVSPADEPLDLLNLEQFIVRSEVKVSHLAAVHCETTTGLLNDMVLVGDLCRRLNLDLIVDAISSYCAVPIDMREMNISFLAASSNKNLQGMAGVSFVVAEQKKLEKTRHVKPRNFYLNLYAQYHYFLINKQFRFTPPVQTLYALQQAIIELHNEGVSARYARYSKSWLTLVEGLHHLELRYLVDPSHHSRIITAVVEPECSTFNFNELHDFLYKQGITIYPGKLHHQNTFRVANIGDITFEDIKAFLYFLRKYMKGIGWL
jgi:2-aminoethylphosphonate aminotransferase